MEGQTPYQPGPFHITEDRDNTWEVDHIVDSHLKNKKNSNILFIGEAMMTWIVYMWEPKSNLGNAKDAICDFHKSYSSAPCTLSINPADFLLLFQKQLEPFTDIHSCHLPFNHLEVNL